MKINELKIELQELEFKTPTDLAKSERSSKYSSGSTSKQQLDE
jgi:hypothetical protein